MKNGTPLPAKTTRIIACGMIAREVLAVNRQLGFDHIDLKCLPADYHHHPEKIAPAMDAAIKEAHEAGFDHVFAGYADCGTYGELDKVCEKHGVKRIEGLHCFAFYMGNDVFEKQHADDLTSFYFTDFLARHFETFLLRPLGIDRHRELKDLYFGNYEKVVYLAQTDDRELDRKAREAARYLGLDYERRLTGYGDLLTEFERELTPRGEEV